MKGILKIRQEINVAKQNIRIADASRAEKTELEKRQILESRAWIEALTWVLEK